MPDFQAWVPTTSHPTEGLHHSQEGGNGTMAVRSAGPVMCGTPRNNRPPPEPGWLRKAEQGGSLQQHGRIQRSKL
jgi:hypothetical protein